MRLRIATVTAVFRSAFANPDLREVGFAYALFSSSEFGTWIILLVYAYARGGVSAELLISLVQLLPCVVLAPLIGSVSERWPPARALAVGYAVQAVAIGAVGAAMAAGSPAWVVYALSPLTTLAFCITRPSQSALLPSVVRTAEELTAANVLTGWTEGLAGLVGPGLAGVLLAWRGTAAATVAMSLLVVASTLLVVRVIRRAPASLGSTGGGGAPGGPADRHDPARRAGARAHVAATLHNPHIRVLLVLTLFFYVLSGPSTTSAWSWPSDSCTWARAVPAISTPLSASASWPPAW